MRCPVLYDHNVYGNIHVIGEKPTSPAVNIALMQASAERQRISPQLLKLGRDLLALSRCQLLSPDRCYYCEGVRGGGGGGGTLAGAVTVRE